MASWIVAITSYFVLFGTAVALLYLYFDRKFRYWEFRGVKSPTFYEFLCNVREILSTPIHVTQFRHYKKYGRIFGECGVFPNLTVGDPHLVKQILVKDFHVFRNRMRRAIGPECLQMMLTMLCDDDWKRIRCIFSPTFSSSKMRKMAFMVRDCADSATKYLDKIAEKDEEIDVREFFAALSVDVIAATAFATKIDSLDDPNNKFMANARKLTNRDASALSLIIGFSSLRLAKLLNMELFPTELFDCYRSVVMKILKEREETKVRGNDFLQLMMDAKDGYIDKTAEDAKEEREDSEEPHVEILPKHRTMTLEEVICQCIMFFVAGHDVTMATLSNVAYRLAMNPDCQEKLISEVNETWQKYGEIDFDIVNKMQYLDAVVCETGRIDTTNTLLFREANEDYELGDTGITIPKGTNVVIPTYSMHHDPEWFPDPEKFDPDRFLPENKHLITPFTYLPFGEGPRNCIAMRFATMVIKLCLVYVLKNVRFVATEETKKPLDYLRGPGVLHVRKMPLKVEKIK